MGLMKSTCLKIWIKGHPIIQGKFAEVDGKPYYFANMTPAKWFRNFAGYAIAHQIIEGLPPRTKIIYKRVDLNTHYITTKTKFKKHGILVPYGDHRQWVLPLSKWEVKPGMPVEPKDLPVDDLQDWKHGEVNNDEYKRQGGRLAEIARQNPIIAEAMAKRSWQSSRY